MSIITTEVAVGAWENRTTLTYVPCNERLPGVGHVDAFGRKTPEALKDVYTRRPYKVDAGNSVTYVKYDSGVSPIFRITES